MSNFKGRYNDPVFYTRLAMSKGFNLPFAVDEQNSRVHQDIIGTLTTDGSSAKKNNRVIVEVTDADL